MANIIAQIQKDTLDHKIAVSTLLRKVKLTAAKLGLPQIENWVDKELKGYGQSDELPRYREIQGTPVARGAFGKWQPMVTEPAFAEKASIAPIHQSVPGIEAQLRSAPPNGTSILPYSAGLLAELNKANRGRIVQCGVSFEAANFEAIVEAVRTLILEWAIQMEQAGISGSEISFSEEEKNRAQATPLSIHISSIGTFTGNLGELIGWAGAGRSIHNAWLTPAPRIGDRVAIVGDEIMRRSMIAIGLAA